MRITIEVEPAGAKRWVLAAIGVVVLGTAVGAYALPGEFTPGEVLTAARLNESFGDLKQQIDAKQVPIITAWKDYTPRMLTASNVEVSACESVGRHRRVGDSVEVVIATRITETPAPSGTFYHWTLPDDVKVDLSKISGWGSNTTASLGGIGSVSGPSVTQYVLGTPYIRSPTTLSLSPSGNWYVTDTAPFTLGADYYIYLEMTVPVEGWGVSE